MLSSLLLVCVLHPVSLATCETVIRTVEPQLAQRYADCISAVYVADGYPVDCSDWAVDLETEVLSNARK